MHELSNLQETRIKWQHANPMNLFVFVRNFVVDQFARYCDTSINSSISMLNRKNRFRKHSLPLWQADWRDR